MAGLGVLRGSRRSVAVLALAGALTVSGLAGAPAQARAPAPICATAPSTARNVNTDCETDGNHFETSVAVNPTNPANIVGAVIKISGSGPGNRQVVVRPHVTFDGGRTWATYAVDYGGRNAVDPSVAFDAAGTVYLASTRGADDVVTRSTDGGRTWSPPTTVAAGSIGAGGGVFNDHPQLTALGDGEVVLTWIRDVFGPDRTLASAPVYASVSHDRGVTWTPPRNVSGSAPFCTGRGGGTACDQTFGNSVAVSRAGAVVTFQQTSDESPDAGAALGRNKYLAVLVDLHTGARIRGPYLIGQAYDGINEHDYPVGAQGVQTVHDSQFNLDGMGNVAADPSDPSGLHLAIVWYDDRSAPHPVSPDPYAAVTDADVIVSQTRDAGRSWSPPEPIRLPNDQFMPWAAYDAGGHLHIGFFDRAYDPANHRYGYTLATETAPGSLRFSFSQVTTGLSDPTRDNLATAGTVDPAFPNPAVSIGDYTAVAAGPLGIATLWTDLRNTACLDGRCGFRQDAYFANVPHG